jgi:hypothetical protein
MPIVLEKNGGNVQDLTIEFTQENFNKLVNQNAILITSLQGIIDSCVHPTIAVRAVMVNLAPIREAIKKSEELFIKIDPTSK